MAAEQSEEAFYHPTRFEKLTPARNFPHAAVSGFVE